MRLLFLNGEYTHTIDVIRIIKKYIPTVECHILVKNSSIFCKSSYVDFVHFLPEHQNIINEVYRLNKYFQFDWVIPIGFPEIKRFSENKNRFPNVFVEDPKVINTCTYKPKALEIAHKLGIPVPASKLIKNISDLNTTNIGLRCPLFIKSSEEMGSSIMGIARNKKALIKLCLLIFKQKSKPLIQEYINSPFTYGVGIYAFKGHIREYFMHRELLSMPPLGGSGVILEKFYDDILLDYSRRLIKELNYTGLALIEYKKHPQKRDYYFMEINSKFWASIAFALDNNPRLLPFLHNSQNIIKLNSLKQKAHFFIYPDRFIKNFRYKNKLSFISCLLYIFSKKGVKKVRFDIKDVKYEIFCIASGILSLLPKYIKQVIKKILT